MGRCQTWSMAEGTKSCVELIQRKKRKLGTDMLTISQRKVGCFACSGALSTSIAGYWCFVDFCDSKECNGSLFTKIESYYTRSRFQPDGYHRAELVFF